MRCPPAATAGDPQVPAYPGIDAAGVVAESSVAEFAAGDEVIVTGYDLGMNTAGGFGQYIRVPAAWVIKRPQGLSLREAMILGTAGLTAALCVESWSAAACARPWLGAGHRRQRRVGSIAVELLAKLGYTVAAATGKLEQAEFLNRLGAKQILDRATVADGVDKPLLRNSGPARWTPSAATSSSTWSSRCSTAAASPAAA